MKNETGTEKALAPQSGFFAGGRRGSVLAAVGIGTFMSALDGSVVNTVLPILRRDLHTTVAGIEWVTTVYLLVVSAILLGVGRAGDLYGHKRLYIAGFAAFVGGSALCGLAPSAGALIGLRGLQALGAAMLFANAPAILTKSFPAEYRGRALGLQGTFTYLGLTTGPSLGGWLATALGWRSVFYINIPVGALGILISMRAIEKERPGGAREPFDLRGAILFTIGLVSLLIVLNQGHAWGWISPLTLVMFLGSAAVLWRFVQAERSTRSPMLDLSLFASKVFRATTTSALLNYICLFCVMFVLPFLLIQGRGMSAQQAGLVLTAQPIVMAVVAPLSGAMSDRFGPRILATAGMVILTVGLVLLAFASHAASLAPIPLSLAVVGLGTGIFVSPNNSALMGSAPRHRQGIAAGVLATARNVGMVLGVGISGAVFTTVMARAIHLPPQHAIIEGVRWSLFTGAAIGVVGTWITARGTAEQKA